MDIQHGEPMFISLQESSHEIRSGLIRPPTD